MAKWTDYTTDTEPTDNDEVMTLDADKSPKANNRVTLSTLADYFLDKLASKVFAKLETQNKTVIGALNELNSKAFFADIECGTATITGESNKVAFSKKHSEKPRIILASYSEENSSIGGEPKILKIYAKTLTGFGVAVSAYDGSNRNFSWIAIW